MQTPPLARARRREDRHDDDRVLAVGLRRLAASRSRSSRTATRSRRGGRATRRTASRRCSPRRASAPSSSSRSASVEDRRRRASAPSSASSCPAPRRRRAPVVFFETESPTLAPSSSSAARACSRDSDSSVPVIDVRLPGQRALLRPLLLARLEPQAELAQLRRRARGSPRRRTTRRSTRRGRGRCPRPPARPPASPSSSASTTPKCAREVARGDPADVGDVQAESTRQNGTAPSTAWIASIAFVAEISPKPSSSSSCSFVSR